jgi:hypothetical protein
MTNIVNRLRLLLAFAAICSFHNAHADSVYGSRPLVGVVDYEGLNNFGKVNDEISLTPPKWNYRLPFYASITNDNSRLARTANTRQEIVYKASNDISHCLIYAAFNDAEPVNATNDIRIYTSPNNTTYTPWTYLAGDVRTINYATNWQKVSYKADSLPAGTRYLKIAICKTNGSTANPQLMRSEIYTNTAGPDLVRVVDDYNDYSAMYSHSNNLTFATDNPGNFALVTADDNTLEIMEQQIAYANDAHIDYFAWLDVPITVTPPIVENFRSSTKKGNLKYCIIVHYPGGETWNNRADRYVSYFQDSSYVKVLDGRPLIYIYQPATYWSKAEMDLLRSKA